MVVNLGIGSAWNPFKSIVVQLKRHWVSQNKRSFIRLTCLMKEENFIPPNSSASTFSSINKGLFRTKAKPSSCQHKMFWYSFFYSKMSKEWETKATSRALWRQAKNWLRFGLGFNPGGYASFSGFTMLFMFELTR